MKPADYKVYLELVRLILRQPLEYDWSYQGLGMLRLYLGDVARLHIWDQRHAVPNVSTLHNHSWSLDSLVLSGMIINQRFAYATNSDYSTPRRGYWRQRLVCGYNSETVGHPVRVDLIPQALEYYQPGESYSQKATEIHSTMATPGTITLMQRTFDGEDQEADVFYRTRAFVSAKPRKATEDEIILFTESAKARLTLPTAEENFDVRAHA